ncbi:MAG: hypothetical protein JWQ34_2805 [Mucilaginibacter sp.]|nr:hypothetical protein [Mucilaginibacter sp.]
MQKGVCVPILKSSRTTYFDSLTGITEIESGEFSDKLKIKGKPELQKNEKSRGLKKHVINEVLRELLIVYGEW